MKKLLSSYFILLLLLACRPQSGKNGAANDNSKKEQKLLTKPPAAFSDTLEINSRAAVFYYPDSIQLEKIKAGIGTSTFDAIMHEYYYQFRFVHIELGNQWPGIKIVEAKNARHLLFMKADKSREIIGLDTKYDPYGLFVFHPQKDPVQLELTNAVSEIDFYFPPEMPPTGHN